MFQIKPKPTFAAKVALREPGAPEVLVPFTFRHMGKAALERWIASASADADKLAEIIADWEVAEGAERVPFTKEALATFLDAYPSAAVAIFTAYVRELTEARTKN